MLKTLAGIAIFTMVLFNSCKQHFELRPLTAFQIDSGYKDTTVLVSIIYSSGSQDNKRSEKIYRQYLVTDIHGKDTIRVLSKSDITPSESEKRFFCRPVNKPADTTAMVMCNTKYKEIEEMKFPVIVGEFKPE